VERASVFSLLPGEYVKTEKIKILTRKPYGIAWVLDKPEMVGYVACGWLSAAHNDFH
jgi:hypothetical protein